MHLPIVTPQRVFGSIVKNVQVISKISSKYRSTAHTCKKLKYRQMKKFLALSLSDALFIMLINLKIPTIVGILTLMSRINFVLS